MSQVTVQQAIDTARRHQAAGELRQAETIYRQVLSEYPRYPDALHLLGTLALQCKKPALAVDLIRQAIAVHPAEPDYHYNLGLALGAGELHEEAVEAYRQAVALKPDFGEALNNLGMELLELRRLEESAAALRGAAPLLPDSAEVLCNLSDALRQVGEIDDALAAAQRAVSLQPHSAAAHVTLGAALFQNAEYHEAIDCHRHAISLQPDLASAQYSLGTALLKLGEYEEGWRQFEWRWWADELKLRRPAFSQPLWDGSDLTGRRILLRNDQGYGDAIQFSRYALLVAQRGGRVILAVPSALARLMGRLAGVEQIVTETRQNHSFDVHCPLLSLPMVFKTTLRTVPALVPYLSADPELAAQWRQKMQISADKLAAGLVWAGRPANWHDRVRSTTLSELAALAVVPNVRFYSLQKGDGAEQLRSVPPTFEVMDLGRAVTDFADTAAIMENLDLVISVDSAPVHLAGAMGKRVWCLLPFIADWRWLIDRDDSPWYPTMRLFRQPRRGDWATPIAGVVDALREVSANHHSKV